MLKGIEGVRIAARSLQEGGVAQLRIAQDVSVLDKTWEAIRVAAPLADMEFMGATVHDTTIDEWYMDRDGFPVDIPFGHSVRIGFHTENVGDVTLYVRLYNSLIDPAGTIRWEEWTDDAEPIGLWNDVNPGVSFSSFYPPSPGIEIDMNGLWLIYGIIEFAIK